MDTATATKKQIIGKKPKYDEEKFTELVLYVAQQMRDVPTYGATMLNKVLFFSDFFHYEVHGTAISGADYYRLDYGPAPRRLVPVREKLVASGRAVLCERQIGPQRRTQLRLEAVDEPDLKKFSPSEIGMVLEVIELLKGRTATDVSGASHRMLGWQVARDRETIPYETVFLISTPITANDRETARRLNRDLVASAA
jgi:hypothetical protein